MPIQKIKLSQIKATDSVTYDHFGHQVDGMKIPKVAVIIATEGQTSIDVATAFGNADRAFFDIGNKQLQVYVNGSLQQTPQAYTEDTGANAGKKITFTEALVDGDQVVVRLEGVGAGYINPQSHTHVWREVLDPAPDGVRTTFELDYTPHEGSEFIFLDGVAMRPGTGFDYTISGRTVTFIRTNPPDVGSNIQANYVR
jgi:hypothetical protein